MEIILVRHTSVDVPEGYCYGQTDVPLRDSFSGEADTVREALAAAAGEGPFDAVYTSPLSRCTRLAEWCGHGGALRDGRLLELDFGAWEMQAWDSLPGAEAWFLDWVHTPAPGGESFMDQYRRVGAFLEEMLAGPWRRVLVFCHGGVIGCARAWLDELPLDEVFKEPAPYGAVVRFLK